MWEACVRGRDVEQMVDQERTRMIPNRFSNQFSIFAMGYRNPGLASPQKSHALRIDAPIAG
jgi:hypothetical protein